ncbi:hypothetical protein OHB12_16760 [Nocardia sp. NBC_01730]|uniref:hypothetical protein n=1 Tax=Nocardia sp. NBC_01730 TaxID=2975998 RepID=UPI002E10B653|nr:hypothetical protein OHB12_16760 [Nocardia sp. NBC_01730]
MASWAGTELVSETSTAAPCCRPWTTHTTPERYSRSHRIVGPRSSANDIFTNDEWELFEQLLLERWRPQAEFGLVSMARPSEVGALLVRDIDPETGAVRINKAGKDDGTRLRLAS